MLTFLYHALMLLVGFVLPARPKLLRQGYRDRNGEPTQGMVGPVGLVLGAVGCYLLFALLRALARGEVPCGAKGCAGQIYTLANRPARTGPTCFFCCGACWRLATRCMSRSGSGCGHKGFAPGQNACGCAGHHRPEAGAWRRSGLLRLQVARALCRHGLLQALGQLISQHFFCAGLQPIQRALNNLLGAGLGHIKAACQIGIDIGHVQAQHLRFCAASSWRSALVSDQAADLLAEYAASSPPLIHEATDSTLSSARRRWLAEWGPHKGLAAIGTGNGPWHGYDQAAVSLTAAIKALARAA